MSTRDWITVEELNERAEPLHDEREGAVWTVEPHYEGGQLVEWRAMLNVDRHPDGRIRACDSWEAFDDESAACEFAQRHGVLARG